MDETRPMKYEALQPDASGQPVPNYLGLISHARIPAAVLTAILLSFPVSFPHAGQAREFASGRSEGPAGPVTHSQASSQQSSELRPQEANSRLDYFSATGALLAGKSPAEGFISADSYGNPAAQSNLDSVVSLARRTREKAAAASKPVTVIDNDVVEMLAVRAQFEGNSPANRNGLALSNSSANHTAMAGVPEAKLFSQRKYDRTERVAATGQSHAEGDRNSGNTPSERTANQDELPAIPALSVHQDAPNHPQKDNGPIAIYEHGQLKITAENVQLSEIMAALHNVMGAEVDLPVGASDERVWAHLGPGPARKILSDLLVNTDLDYVIQGSAQDVNGIQSVTLTVRTDTPAGRPATPSESAARSDDRRTTTPSSTAKEENVREEPAAAANAAQVPPPPSDTPGMDRHPGVFLAQPAADDSISHPGVPASLTQDQIVQQLTNMYQQRKQMAQRQAGSTSN